MLAVTCASWAGTHNILEGKWGVKIGLYYYHIEDGLAVISNANMSETGGPSGGGVYDGIVTIPATIVYDGETIPVVGIQDYAFFNCPELVKVIIPSSIATIGEHAFTRSPKLSTIEVDEDNNYFYSKDNILYSHSNEIVAVPVGKTFGGGQFTIPTGITKIRNYAFEGCNNISKVILPASLQAIGNYAFSNCTNLETINLSTNISSMGEGVFSNCNNLAIDFVLPKNMNKVPDGFFYNCNKLKSVKLNSSTTSIGTEAFYGCTALKTISLPQNLIEICPKAFYNAGLTSIEIPGGVEIISSAAFANTKLTSIKLNEGVKVVDQSAFSNISTNIVEVSFPASVTNINNYAFNKSYVQNFYIHSTSAETELGYFSPFQKMEELKIHVFQGMANEFKNAKNWSNYKDYIVDDEGA